MSTCDLLTNPTISKQSKQKSGELDALELGFVKVSKSISSRIDVVKESALVLADIKKEFTYKADVHEKTFDKRIKLFLVICMFVGLSQKML